MNIIVLGATGQTGLAVVKEALSRGHRVTTLVRSPEKLAGMNYDDLQILTGNLLESSELANCLKTQQDTIVSVIGSHSLKPSSIRTDIAKATVKAMKQKGVQRILILSAGIVDNSKLIPSVLSKSILKNVTRDLKGMEQVIMDDSLEWTIVRASKLTNKQGNNRYKINDKEHPYGAFTARRIVAKFMIDEAEQKKHIRSIVGISNG